MVGQPPGSSEVAKAAATWLVESRSFITISFAHSIDAIRAEKLLHRYIRNLARIEGEHIRAVIYTTSRGRVTHGHLVVDVDVETAGADAAWRYALRRHGLISSGRPRSNVDARPIRNNLADVLRVNAYGARHGDSNPAFACPRLIRSCRRPRGCKHHPSRSHVAE